MEKSILVDKNIFCHSVGRIAVQSLLDELELTPKPGLVDQLDCGAHNDLSLEMMRASAYSLKETFINIARISYKRKSSQSLREEIAEIGRSGEKTMFKVTNGVNTHKGAIWALGLLVSAFATKAGELDNEEIAQVAGQIAKYPDRFYSVTQLTNGERVKKKFGVNGAKEQAEKGFPHIIQHSLPTLKSFRKAGWDEKEAQLFSLLSLIAHLDDTCVLHRGGMEGITFVKNEAKKILQHKNLNKLYDLNKAFIERNISPGGSADLLAATIFLERLQVFRKQNTYTVTV